MEYYEKYYNPAQFKRRAEHVRCGVKRVEFVAFDLTLLEDPGPRPRLNNILPGFLRIQLDLAPVRDALEQLKTGPHS